MDESISIIKSSNFLKIVEKQNKKFLDILDKEIDYYNSFYFH